MLGCCWSTAATSDTDRQGAAGERGLVFAPRTSQRWWHAENASCIAWAIGSGPPQPQASTMERHPLGTPWLACIWTMAVAGWPTSGCSWAVKKMLLAHTAVPAVGWRVTPWMHNVAKLISRGEDCMLAMELVLRLEPVPAV